MFLYLSKIVFFFIRPSNALLFLFGLGLAALLIGRRKTGTALVGLAFVLLLAAGLGPTANLLLTPLETRFPAPDLGGPVDGVIILGGALDTVISEEHEVPVLAEAGERVVAAAVLARRFPKAPILLSGGKPALFPGALSEADETANLLVSLGVDKERILKDNESRNTWQNAVYSRQVARPEAGARWLLVTSAYHMPRAVGTFRKAGWPEVIPYPVDYRSAGLLRPFPSVAKGLRYTDVAVREWIGLVAYGLSGRIEGFFPAPRGE